MITAGQWRRAAVIYAAEADRYEASGMTFAAEERRYYPDPAPEAPAPDSVPDPEPAIDWQARAVAAEAEASRLRAVVAEAAEAVGAGLRALLST